MNTLMTNLIAVVAVDEDWAIGNKGKLLFHEPQDLKNFKTLTSGNAIIYGSKTLRTFPNKKPLPSRYNIIFSHNQNLKVAGAEVVSSVEDLFELREKSSCHKDDYLWFVVGGEQIYNLLLPYCTYCMVTQFFCKAPEKDAFFPNLDESSEWEIIDSGPLFQPTKEGDPRFRHFIYSRI